MGVDLEFFPIEGPRHHRTNSDGKYDAHTYYDSFGMSRNIENDCQNKLSALAIKITKDDYATLYGTLSARGLIGLALFFYEFGDPHNGNRTIGLANALLNGGHSSFVLDPFNYPEIPVFDSNFFDTIDDPIVYFEFSG